MFWHCSIIRDGCPINIALIKLKRITVRTECIWTYAIGVSLEIHVILAHVSAILIVLLRFLLTLAETTTVRLATMLLVIHKHFFPMIPCGMGSSVLVWRLPAVLTPNMPWFTKTLGETTTEDIQLRLCNDHGIGDEETLLQLIDLYVYWHKQFFCSMQWLCITVWIVISLHIPKLCS